MQCHCWDADCEAHIACSVCMLMQSLCQRPDALLCVQPVLILENEDAVAEVLQLSSVPIPGGHLQPSLLVCLLLICHEVRRQQLFHTCCHVLGQLLCAGSRRQPSPNNWSTDRIACTLWFALVDCFEAAENAAAKKLATDKCQSQEWHVRAQVQK